MFTALNTIPFLAGKSREIRVLFADTANEALTQGRSESEAIFKGLAIVKQAEQKSIKKFVKPSAPSHLQVLLDLKNNSNRHQEVLQESEMAQPNLPQGNDVIAANFDQTGRLILKLADGKTITSNVAPITAVETNVIVVGDSTGGGGSTPLDEGIDGGSATSVFKPTEILDGGSASG